MKIWISWLIVLVLGWLLWQWCLVDVWEPNECYGMTVGKSVKLKAPLDKQVPEIDLLLENIVLALQRRIPTKDASCILTCDGQVVVMDGDVVTFI